MMRAFVLSALLMTSSFAFANPFKSGSRTLKSFISITKLESSAKEDKFVFKVCNGANCEVLGSAAGYTDAQIQKLNGRLQEIGAGGMVIAEVGVIVMTSGVGATVGAAAGAVSEFTTLGMYVGGASGIAIPYAAFKFIKKLNPLVQLKRGDAKLSMQNGVHRLEQSRQASIIIFESSKLSETLSRADLVQHALDLL